MTDDRQPRPDDPGARGAPPESPPRSIAGAGAKPKRLAVRILRLLLYMLAGVIAGLALWLVAAIRFLRRVFTKQTPAAPATSPRSDPVVQRAGLRRSLARQLVRHARWRTLGIAAALLVLAGAGLGAGCGVTCFGLARYFLASD